MCPARLLPAIGRDKQLLTAAEREAVLDPDGVVAQRPAQAEKRADLAGGEGALPIGSCEWRAPDTAEWDGEWGGEQSHVAIVQLAEYGQGIEYGVIGMAVPGQADEAPKETAHRPNAVDEPATHD